MFKKPEQPRNDLCICALFFFFIKHVLNVMCMHLIVEWFMGCEIVLD